MADTGDDIAALIAAASPGDVICLEDGEYGNLTTAATKGDYVTVRSLNPGGAVFGEILLPSGAAFLRFEGLVADEIAGYLSNAHHIHLLGCSAPIVEAESPLIVSSATGAHDWLIEFCDVPSYPGLGIAFQGHDPSQSRPVSNMTVRGCRIGPDNGSGADAIRISNWSNVLIEDTEFFGIIENGLHSDGIQSVWGGSGLTFQRNYLHDNNCEPIFLKDGWFDGVLIDNNLIIRNDAGPEAVYSDIWNAGGIEVVRNVILDSFSLSHNPPAQTGWPSGPFGFHDVHLNVIASFIPYDYVAPSGDANRAGIFNDNDYMVEDYNIITGGWTWQGSGKLGPHSSTAAPSFVNATTNPTADLASGDFRLAAPITVGGDTFTPGIDWLLAGRKFGVERYLDEVA